MMSHACWSLGGRGHCTDEQGFRGQLHRIGLQLNNARMRWRASGVCEDKGDGANVLYSRLCCTPDGRGVCTYAELLLL
jgi:hypothetical protein